MKITKEKIKEVEEEWQSNLLNWKSKRRQSSERPVRENGFRDNNKNGIDTNGVDTNGIDTNGVDGRGKIKTFSEILKEKSKSGARIGYNLHHYLEGEDQMAPFDDAPIISPSMEEQGKCHPFVSLFLVV